MKQPRHRFSDLHAPGARLTWQSLLAISLAIGLPVGVVLELAF